MIEVGSDFSGVGAFDQALQRLGIEYRTVFACDIDKYARQTYIENYGNPQYFPNDVYEREIPKEPLEIYMTSPPCQAFSIAGFRKGEDDHRGILFYNSHEFIKKNRPRYFIFENVKGLLSDDKGNTKDEMGRTFRRWLDLLGGKSVNGNPIIFPHEESVPYHVYWQVLNAKDYGVPQNRERVFIIGIRDDEDNEFCFPRPIPLELRLKDVLQDNPHSKYLMTKKKIEHLYNRERSILPTDPNKKDVANCVISGYHKIPTDGEYILENTEYMEIPDKYYLSEELIQGFIKSSDRHIEIANALRANGALCKTDNSIIESGTWRTHKDGRGFRKIEDGNCPTIPARAREDGSGQPVIKITEPNVELKFLGATKPHNRGNGSNSRDYSKQDRVYDAYGLAETIPSQDWTMGAYKVNYRIRRLTPRECFRLMDFSDSFKWSVSDTQAYKQAGNSIVVGVLCEIIKKLKL